VCSEILTDAVGIITLVREEATRPVHRHREKIENREVVGRFATRQDKAKRRPWPSARAWIFVVKPPRD